MLRSSEREDEDSEYAVVVQSRGVPRANPSLQNRGADAQPGVLYNTRGRVKAQGAGEVHPDPGGRDLQLARLSRADEVA